MKPRWPAISTAVGSYKVGVIHRNDVRLDARSGTRAMHGGSEAGNGKATDDTD